jgi:glycosyltransferase involved in cell wall biosynthesis
MPAFEVSVVMPARDACVTVRDAARSVLASRGIRLELVCVDDGSRDATGDRLAELARSDERVKVLRTPPRGIVHALNAGLAAARAPLVARMDADDEMLPERLRAQVDLLEREPEVALVGCRVESFRRRDVVRRLGGYRERGWPEDLDLLYRLLAAGHRVAKLDRVLHRWRDHAGRLSRVDPRYGREAFARVKAHFVGRLQPMRSAVLWGAGRTGRRFARLLAAEGITTRAFIDIRSDRAGTTWRGIPILSPDALPARVAAWRREVPILGAVASRGARSEIRRCLRSHGLEEGEDFWMVA